MPGKRRSHRHGDHRLEDALRALSSALTERGVPWSVIGGVAVITHGVRRMTTDIDAVVAGDELEPAAALELLAQHGFEPRMDAAVEFATMNLVLLLRHAPTGVDVDLSFGWTEFERRAIAASMEMSFGRVRAPVTRPAHLVAFKAIAGRVKDLEDATTLLLLHPDIDTLAVRRQVEELAALAEAPELIAGLDRVLRDAEAARHDAASAPATPPAPGPHATRSPAPRKRGPKR